MGWKHEDVWNDEERIRVAVSESKSLRNTLINLGIEPGSDRYARLKAQCKAFGIPLDFPNPRSHSGRTPNELVFANPSVFGRNNGKELKTRALSLGYVENQCSECGVGSEWNNKPLTLHLDHMDGNHKNNLPVNLRMLCPNCHSQTPTHSYRNAKKDTCINGHPWKGSNLIQRTRFDGDLRINVCKDCDRERKRRSRTKERERMGWA